MTARQHRVTLRSPLGVELDLTDRIDDDGLGTMTDSLDEQIVQITVGELDLEVVDEDGTVEAFLAPGVPGDMYEVTVEGETGLRRPKWRRLFGGVLDLPFSVSIDRQEKRVSVTAFSYAKLLELASAETIRRTVTGRTGTVAVDSAVVTVSSSTDLLIGDDITLAVAAVDETHRIVSVDSATQVTTDETWDNAFTAAALTLETPYYRDKSLAWLADALLTAGGIPQHEVSIGHDISTVPISTAMSRAGTFGGAGLPATVPRSIMQLADEILITYASGQRKGAVNPRDGFRDAGAINDALLDWRPYELTQPTLGAIEAYTGNDNGTVAPDFTNGFQYGLAPRSVPDTPTDHQRLWLQRDGVDLIQIDNYNADDPYLRASSDFDPVNNYVWCSYERNDGTQALKYRDIGGAATVTVTSGAGTYRIPRCIRPLNAMAAFSGSSIELYDLTSKMIVRTITNVPAGLVPWTLRAWDTWLAGLAAVGAAWYVVVWDTSTWAEVARYKVASPGTNQPYLTIFTDPLTSRNLAVGFAGNAYFVLGLAFEGVLPYADFEGMSCANALADLALCAGAYLRVDQYRIGVLRSRVLRATGTPTEIADPLEWSSTPFGERYVRSVVVTGTDQDGEEVREIAGAAGESQYRLEISSQLISTAGVAQAVGQQYFGLFGTPRSIQELTIEEPAAGVLAALDSVRLDGRNYLVLEAETHLADQEQDIVLLGVD